jgi:acyl-[acyl-carrier-protein] desaturase
MVFYRNLGKAALDMAPNFAMQSILKEVKGFSMPGDTIPHFYEHAVKIANAGIYDLQLHVDQVLTPTLKYWNVFEREDLSGEGEAAREELDKTLNYLKKAASKYVERREEERTTTSD